MADAHYTIIDDGLSKDWFGRVWLNPPYGRHTGTWLNKLAEHGRGTALIFARTETRMFVDCVWSKATAVLFLAGRLTFHNSDGSIPTANSGAPSVLVAYGRADADRLAKSGLSGFYTDKWIKVGDT
jgi:hypothetical protein